MKRCPITLIGTLLLFYLFPCSYFSHISLSYHNFFLTPTLLLLPVNFILLFFLSCNLPSQNSPFKGRQLLLVHLVLWYAPLLRISFTIFPCRSLFHAEDEVIRFVRKNSTGYQSRERDIQKDLNHTYTCHLQPWWSFFIKTGITARMQVDHPYISNVPSQFTPQKRGR